MMRGLRVAAGVAWLAACGRPARSRRRRRTAARRIASSMSSATAGTPVWSLPARTSRPAASVRGRRFPERPLSGVRLGRPRILPGAPADHRHGAGRCPHAVAGGDPPGRPRRAAAIDRSRGRGAGRAGDGGGARPAHRRGRRRLRPPARRPGRIRRPRLLPRQPLLSRPRQVPSLQHLQHLDRTKAGRGRRTPVDRRDDRRRAHAAPARRLAEMQQAAPVSDPEKPDPKAEGFRSRG